MRIISGQFKGRILKTPHGNKTHPMSEKIRGAIFNALGDIKNLKILDAYSGTGAIAIEAESNGADYIVSIDSSKEAMRVIKNNLASVNSQKIKPINANVSSWSDNNEFVEFDIVICDPPYDGVQTKILYKLERHVKDGGLFILSLPPGIIYNTGLNLILEKDYNDAVIRFYRKAK